MKQPLTDYIIYIKDLTIGRTEQVEATSNSGKELKATIYNYFTASHSYELWVTLKSATSPDDKEEILIDSKTETENCFSLRFIGTYNDGDKQSQDTITLKAA